jgi:hypothetical protein
MDYTPLRRMEPKTRQRIIAGLKKLRIGLKTQIPPKGPGSLLLATWNIREFGGTKYGGRIDDARFFISECLNHFDLVAVQEVRRDLNALRTVMRLLGPHWDVIFTDVSYAQGGNSERLAFLFDKNQLFFTGLAGELVLPPKASQTVAQIARTPFICGFQAGWAKFNLCTVGSLKNVAATAVYAATSCCRLQPRVSAVSADLAPNIRILSAITPRISAQNAAASRLRLMAAAVR